MLTIGFGCRGCNGHKAVDELTSLGQYSQNAISLYETGFLCLGRTSILFIEYQELSTLFLLIRTALGDNIRQPGIYDQDSVDVAIRCTRFRISDQCYSS